MDLDIDELVQSAQAFALDPTSRPEDRALLWRALNARPAYQFVADLLPADEAAQRLDLARRIEAQHRAIYVDTAEAPQLSAFAFSVLCIVPIHVLQEMAEAVQTGQPALGSLFIAVEKLTRISMVDESICDERDEQVD